MRGSTTPVDKRVMFWKFEFFGVKEMIECRVVKDGNNYLVQMWHVRTDCPKCWVIGNQYVFNTNLIQQLQYSNEAEAQMCMNTLKSMTHTSTITDVNLTYAFRLEEDCVRMMSVVDSQEATKLLLDLNKLKRMIALQIAQMV